MAQDRPLRILIKDFLPIGIVSDLRSRMNQTDWDGFFDSLFATGFVLTAFSMIGFILVYFILSILAGNSDIIDRLTSLILNIPVLVIAIYIPWIFLLKGVNSTSESRLEIIGPSETVEKFAKRIRAAPGFEILHYVVNIVLLSAMVGTVAFVRNVLIIADTPSQDLYSLSFYFELSLILLADFTYIGLLLVTISHWYMTVKSQPV